MFYCLTSSHWARGSGVLASSEAPGEVLGALASSLVTGKYYVPCRIHRTIQWAGGAQGWPGSQHLSIQVSPAWMEIRTSHRTIHRASPLHEPARAKIHSQGLIHCLDLSNPTSYTQVPTPTWATPGTPETQKIMHIFNICSSATPLESFKVTPTPDHPILFAPTNHTALLMNRWISAYLYLYR